MLGVKVIPVVRSSKVVALSPPLVSDMHHMSASSWKPVCHIYSRFQKMQEIPAHPNLCAYIDLVHARHDKLIIVREHYPESVTSKLHEFSSSSSSSSSPEDSVALLAFSILRALEHLSKHHVVSRNVSIDTIVYDKGTNTWKLTDYGLFDITQHGSLVPFFIG